MKSTFSWLIAAYDIYLCEPNEAKQAPLDVTHMELGAYNQFFQLKMLLTWINFII